MTLAKLAKDLGTTRARLRNFADPGCGDDARKRHDELRQFIAVAFCSGYDMEQIQDYVGRSDTMVLHALRMVCVDEYGCQYGQTLDEISRVLRMVAA